MAKMNSHPIPAKDNQCRAHIPLSLMQCNRSIIQFLPMWTTAVANSFTVVCAGRSGAAKSPRYAISTSAAKYWVGGVEEMGRANHHIHHIQSSPDITPCAPYRWCLAQFCQLFAELSSAPSSCLWKCKCYVGLNLTLRIYRHVRV